MLYTVFGRAGSGKTDFSRKFFFLNEEKLSGHRQMLVVPEQYSFESEKAVLRLLGAKRAGAVEVVSFSRLADSFFRTYGNIAGKRLTDGGRAVFMQLAADEVADKLSVYKKAASVGDMTELMLSVISEMKMCGVSPEELLEFSLKTGSESLKQKLSEISYMFAAYEALVAQSYVDPLDDLTRMSAMPSCADFFKDSYIVIDSFSGFTAQELKIIKLMMKYANDVYITFCADGPFDEEHGMGLFSSVQKTAAKVIAAAREIGVKTAKPIILEGGGRFSSPELCFAEQYLFSDKKENYGGENKSVSLYKARDIYDESQYVASEILSLVKSGKYRYKDIFVIGRNTDEYLGVLDTELSKRNIFYFMDKPENIEHKPLIKLVMSALYCVCENFESKYVFDYLKTGLAGLSADETAALQNYTYIWRISGSKFLSPFLENPSGLGREMNENDKKSLAILNKLRERAVSPLVKLKNNLSAASGEQSAKAIYDLLMDISADAALSSLCEKFDAENMPQLSQELMRLWDTLMHVLDESVSIIGDKKIETRLYIRVLDMIFKTETVSDIPRGVDEVTVGSAERIRTEGAKVVFLIGAARGEFPLVPRDNGLFSDSERKELISVGMPIGRTFEEASAEERFISYQAAAAASDRLYISYSRAGGKYPSEMYTKALSVFGGEAEKERKDLDDIFFACAPAPAFSLAASLWSENTPKAAALRKIFSEDEKYAELSKALSRSAFSAPFRLESSETAHALFSGDRSLSASQIETYYMCRFRYFCEYGIRAREIKPAVIDSLQYGSLMHFLLEKLFLNHSAAEVAAMSEESLRLKIRELSDLYAEQNFGGTAGKPKSFTSALSRLCDSAYYLIVHIAAELSQSKFTPEGFEVSVGSGDIIFEIPGESGEKISVAGKIDRVDSMTAQDKRYIRVIDYKTGMKEFRLSDVLNGINLQMFIYLAALVENGKGAPAGVLYMPSARPTINAERNIDEDTLSKEIDKAFKMKGVVLDDTEVLTGMESELRGQYIPFGINGSKKTGEESLLSDAEFKIVIKEIKKKTADMAKTLRSGDIDAVPLMKNKFGCSFCPYFAVCGREFSEADVVSDKMKKEDVLKKIEEEL